MQVWMIRIKVPEDGILVLIKSHIVQIFICKHVHLFIAQVFVWWKVQGSMVKLLFQVRP